MTTKAANAGFDPRPALLKVLLALLPAYLVLLYFAGSGAVIQLLLALFTCCSCDWLCRRIQTHSSPPALVDCAWLGEGSGLVSALLLTLALPSYAPWWVMVSSAAVASFLGKGIFSGFGRNPVNPAMLGVAFALLAYPAQMLYSHQPLSVNAAFAHIFTLGTAVDGWSQATVLDVLRSNDRFTQDELFAQHSSFGYLAGVSSEWLNLAALAGGLWLMQQKVIDWRAPAGMLGALFIISLLCWNGTGSESNGSPLLHLLSGGSMLCAFFICTEPVSGPHSARARLLFGAGVGLLLYAIRTWGHFPDGVAFAVLIMNWLVPRLERWSLKP